MCVQLWMEFQLAITGYLIGISMWFDLGNKYKFHFLFEHNVYKLVFYLILVYNFTIYG